MRVITLTTDFGLRDPYVGIMKGVILGINMDVQIVDICHEISPGDIREAAYVLKEAYGYFPKGSIHVGVIDPGVGGRRRAIAVKTRDYYFVGPDNGLFWPIIEKEWDVEIFQLSEERYFLPNISHTFHGRDIFAPIAAHISKGVELSAFGPAIFDPVPLNLEQPLILRDRIIGKIIRVDRFGNLITNISREHIIRVFGKRDDIQIKIGDMVLSGIKQTYSDVEPGGLLAHMDSSGFLEISVNMGRASDKLGKNPVGMEVIITLPYDAL